MRGPGGRNSAHRRAHPPPLSEGREDGETEGNGRQSNGETNRQDRQTERKQGETGGQSRQTDMTEPGCLQAVRLTPASRNKKK